MPEYVDPNANESIRQLLNRRELAAARHRSALSRQLGLAQSEMMAVAHLAQRGALTPSVLGALLDLSSGGVSALVARLQQAGHVTREVNPHDGRSTLIRLSPALIERAAQAFDPLVSDLDRLSEQLDEQEHEVLHRFLERAAIVCETHADRVHREAEQRGQAPSAFPVPSLWS